MVTSNQKSMVAPKKKDASQEGQESQGGNESQEEILEKFQLELRWCVGQLEAQLSANKDQKQVVQTVKWLKMLTNPKAPVAKKRMVMRSVFGDYRKLMADEEAKLDRAIQKMAVTEMRPTDKTIKGIFYKRCCSTTNKRRSDNKFKFNFKLDASVS